jgi:hypothetical protein
MRSFHAFVAAAFLFAAFPAAPVLAQSSDTKPTCAAGDPVVWVNTSSKVYHTQDDQYYGKTKHGKYACKSAAEAAGNHLSGQKSGAPGPKASAASSGKHHSSSMASPAPSATSSGSKHHHKSKAKASPEPTAT